MFLKQTNTKIVSCVKIQKKSNMLTLGQIKLYIGPVNLKKKDSKFIFLNIENSTFVKKKLLVPTFFFFFFLRFYVYQKKRLDEWISELKTK